MNGIYTVEDIRRLIEEMGLHEWNIRDSSKDLVASSNLSKDDKEESLKTFDYYVENYLPNGNYEIRLRKFGKPHNNAVTKTMIIGNMQNGAFLGSNNNQRNQQNAPFMQPFDEEKYKQQLEASIREKLRQEAIDKKVERLTEIVGELIEMVIELSDGNTSNDSNVNSTAKTLQAAFNKGAETVVNDTMKKAAESFKPSSLFGK